MDSERQADAQGDRGPPCDEAARDHWEVELERAAFSGDVETVMWIIECGFASPNSTLNCIANASRNSLLHLYASSVYSGSPHSPSTMAMPTMAVSINSDTSLFMIEWLVNEGADVHARDANGSTPLHIAASVGNAAVCNLLACAGAQVSALDNNGYAPMHLAARNGHSAAIRSLLRPGRTAAASSFSPVPYRRVRAAVSKVVPVALPDANFRSGSRGSGRTACHIAAAEGRELALATLLELGANVNAEDNDGRTPLFSAIRFRRVPIMHMLLNAGAELKRVDAAGLSAIHHACGRGLDTVQCILEGGWAKGKEAALLRSKDASGRTCLFSAVIYNRQNVVRYLVSTWDAKVNTTDASGQSPLHAAATNGSVELVKTLLDLGAKQLRDKDGVTPLFAYLQSGASKSTDLLQLLLPRGHVDVCDVNGNTVLHMAAAQGQEAMVRFMLGSGATVDTLNANGERAEEVAANDRIKRLLCTTHRTSMSASTDTPSPGGVGTGSAPGSASVEVGTVLEGWEIDMKDVKEGRKLGSGAFGVVYHGQWRNIDVAVKYLQVNEDADDRDEKVEQFLREASLMCKLRHPNICCFYGACTKAPKYCLIMEYLPKTLSQLIKAGPIEVKKVIEMSMDICLGLLYLHECGIVHRDLKPSNVLLDARGRCKLADFGISRFISGTASMTSIGTPRYMAPEMLKTKIYGAAVDVYSFGILLWEMILINPQCTGKKAFGEISASLAPLQVAYKVAYEGLRPTVSSSIARPLRQLMEDCWNSASEVRPSIKTVHSKLGEFIDEGLLSPARAVSADEPTVLCSLK